MKVRTRRRRSRLANSPNLDTDNGRHPHEHDMKFRTIEVLECILAVLAVVAFCSRSTPRWDAWLFGFLLLGVDTWRCLLDGEISTGSRHRWFGFRFNRDDSPLCFTCAIVFQVLLTCAFFLIFLSSL